MQQRDPEIGDDHAPAQPDATLAKGIEDHAAENRRPHAVTERSQDATSELGDDDV